MTPKSILIPLIGYLFIAMTEIVPCSFVFDAPINTVDRQIFLGRLIAIQSEGKNESSLEFKVLQPILGTVKVSDTVKVGLISYDPSCRDYELPEKMLKSFFPTKKIYLVTGKMKNKGSLIVHQSQNDTILSVDILPNSVATQKFTHHIQSGEDGTKERVREILDYAYLISTKSEVKAKSAGISLAQSKFYLRSPDLYLQLISHQIKNSSDREFLRRFFIENLRKDRKDFNLLNLYSQFRFEQSSFMEVVNAGDMRKVQASIDQGADVNDYHQGYTPLYIAAEKGYLSIFHLLLAKGAVLDVSTEFQNDSVLHGACDFNSIMDIDDPKGEKKKQAESAKLEIIQYLIKAKMGIHERNREGMTPLHIAAKSGYQRISQLLLQNSANINAQDNNGWTPLHYAIINDEIQLINYLIKKGANLSVKDRWGESIETMAKEKPEIQKILKAAQE